MKRQTPWFPIAIFISTLASFGVVLAILVEPALQLSQQHSANQSSSAIAALWCLAAIGWVWLVLTTSLSIVRRAIPTLRRCTVLDVATLPYVRIILDRIAVVSLTAATVMPLTAIPAAAQATDAVTAQATPHVRGDDPAARASIPPHVRGSAITAPAGDPRQGPTTTTPVSPATEAPTKPTRTPAATRPTSTNPNSRADPQRATHLVRAGENLWSIARNELQRRDASTNDEAVARYWGELMRLNRNRLRSGNPSLIFVGESVELPA